MAGLGDLMGLMGNLGTLRQRLEAVQDDLARRRVEGASGGGMVVATVSGRLDLVDLKISPEALADRDAEFLEDLVKAAVAQAMDKARQVQREAMSAMLGGLPLPPGLEGMLGL